MILFVIKKYLKTKVRGFVGKIKTNFLDNKIKKKDTYYTCIACVTIDSVLKIEKKNYLQVYLEGCKSERKITKMIKFIAAELKSESESESKSDTELMTKLKSDSDFDTK